MTRNAHDEPDDMTPAGKLWISTVVGSVLTGAYWLGFSFVAYGLTAGDHRPGTGPGDQQELTIAWLVWIAGFLVYTALAWLWRKIDFTIASRRSS